jgi:hypothetical protein
MWIGHIQQEIDDFTAVPLHGLWATLDREGRVALHCQASMDDKDMLEVLADLERLAVGTPVRMDGNVRERMSAVASKLGRQVGVH